MQTLDSETIEAVRALLGVQLRAVQQHFIHVLILQARGNHTFADRITAIDNTDLSVAMQWIERLVAQNIDPLNGDTAAAGLGASMPDPGFSDEGIRLSEIALENDLADRLKNALGSVSCGADEDVRGLLARAMRPRTDYRTWLHREAEVQTPRAPVADAPAGSDLPDDVGLSLHGLFANLMTLITQELVHAFVHRQADNRARADAAWEISGAAMMKATQMTRLLAGHRIAPAPQTAVAASWPVQAPRIELNSNGALLRGRALARYCAETAGTCAELLTGTDFGPVALGCRDYFQSAAVWRDGTRLPDIPNPCRDFERTLDLYVTPDHRSQSA